MSRHRQRKLLLHSEDPYCYWCRCITFVYDSVQNPRRDDEATVDHLYHRFDPKRLDPDIKPKTVLACYKCNVERGHEDWERLTTHANIS